MATATFPSAFAPTPYRNARGSIAERLDELVAQRRREATALPGDVQRLYSRRVGRIAAGSVGALFGLATFGTSTLAVAADTGPLWLGPLLLIAAWPAMLVAYQFGQRLGPHALRASLYHWYKNGDRGEQQLQRLQGTSGEQRADEFIYRLERLSLTMPMVALSLLVPLTLHLLIYKLFSLLAPLSPYAAWIFMSGIIVGHAHLFLAYWSARYVRRLQIAAPPSSAPSAGGSALWYTVGVAAVPGILCWGAPPLLTAVTGLCFIPAMFEWARTTLARERARVTIEA